MRKSIKRLFFIKASLLCLFIGCVQQGNAQQAYFIDGYHGGVWGHYPIDYTGFIVDQLKKNPDWRVNLEIEPETWDRAKIHEKEAYRQFQEIVNDQTGTRKVEFVNPTYGQSYLFNISGESVIRQFHYGIKKMKEHFPAATFTTYSSEEPCFTSALPQILTLFGFRYASLKTPNTCWGGYTRNFGGELVNWIGPDGTSILTVPRYEFESLLKGSTWETIANANSKEYIHAAFAHGLKNPIGMCLQDAEWRFGPWLKGDFYKPTAYTTWTNYFDNIVDKSLATDWKVSQEDIQVSLVWGSQVLQKIAQQVKHAENTIIQAENLAAMSFLYAGHSWPQEKIDDAWKTLMLSQHHDCWIVPYNGKNNDTWADKVSRWTDTTNLKSDEVIRASILMMDTVKNKGAERYLRLFNTTSSIRKEWVTVQLPAELNPNRISFLDRKGKEIPVQYLTSDSKSVLVFAEIPSIGYASYKMVTRANKGFVGAKAFENSDGTVSIETDIYHLVLDPNKGGAITKLLVKKNNVDYIDQSSAYSFNELRGYFYDQNKFRSSTETKAKISIIENNGAQVRVKVEGSISNSPFQQVITLNQGQKRIDFSVNIEWIDQPKIGEFEEVSYENRTLHKAFYKDKYKLQALFPVVLENQVLHKDAPFDVNKSELDNTFFSTWDSIKNTIILNWVDVSDEKAKEGLALFTDHATSYTHGADYPLGLVIQYVGKGLWGRDYTLTSDTKVHYSVVPHQGDWEDGSIAKENTRWNQPVIASFLTGNLKESEYEKSMIKLDNDQLTVSSLNVVDDKLVIRLFNSSAQDHTGNVTLDFPIKNAFLTNLLNETIEGLETNATENSASFNLKIKKFGLANIQVQL